MMADLFSYFVLGFAAGYIWHPVWIIVKKIWSEAKKAQQEWKK